MWVLKNYYAAPQAAYYTRGGRAIFDTPSLEDPLNQATHATNLRQSAQNVRFQTLRLRIAAKVIS